MNQLHPKRWWKPALVDGVLPFAFFFGVSILIMGDIWRKMHHLVLGGGTSVTPSDVNGTLWFYWWTSQALERGVDLLEPDVICAPTGQALGSNFPQHIDAMMAAPFFQYLNFPSAYNVWAVVLPALGALGAYIAARWLGIGRSLAIMVALLFGFNSLSMHELANGKPPSALVVTLPLFMASWIRCLTTKGRAVFPWVVIAGFAASLTIQAYVLYALIVAFFAAATMVYFGIRPVAGVARKRAWLAGVLVVLIGLSTSAPYLKRLLGDRRPMPEGIAPKITDPAIQREQAESIDVGYIFGVDQNESLPRRAAFPVVLTMMALTLIPFGGTRHKRWLFAAGAFYLLSLGPVAAISVRPEVEWMTIAGRGVPLPTWWLNKIFPFSIQFFHPCRVFPVVVFCAAMSVATGLQNWTKPWVGHRRWAGPFSGVIITILGLFQVHMAGGMEMLSAPWSPHPFVEQLGEATDKQSIIEFPVGLGHATAPAQLVHGWKRSESHHDMVSGLQNNQMPEDCLQLPFLSALWDYSRGASALTTQQSPERPIAASVAPAAIAEAHDSGFRYVVAWRAGFDMLRQAGIDVDREVAIGQVSNVLGPPFLNDEILTVWEIPASGRP